MRQADVGRVDETIAQALHIGTATVERVRKGCGEEGRAAALSERPRPGGQRQLESRREAFLIALACSTPPESCQCWTMQLLADTLVEFRSRRYLRGDRLTHAQQNVLKPWQQKAWCMPRVSAELVWRREDLLDWISTPSPMLPSILGYVAMNVLTNWSSKSASHCWSP